MSKDQLFFFFLKKKLKNTKKNIEKFTKLAN